MSDVGKRERGPRQWNEDEARALVIGLARKKLGLFESCQGIIGLDDLISEGMIRARKAHESYDPAKGAWSTHLCTAVGRRFIDMAREQSRRRNWEAIAVDAAKARGLTAPAAADVAGDLADYLGDVLDSARTAIAGRHIGGRGRPARFAPEQKVALLALLEKLNASSRGLRMTLELRRELVTALKLDRIPSYRVIARLRESVTQFQMRLVGGGGDKAGGVGGRGLSGVAGTNGRARRIVLPLKNPVFPPSDGCGGGDRPRTIAPADSGKAQAEPGKAPAGPGNASGGLMGTAVMELRDDPLASLADPGPEMTSKQAARELRVSMQTLKEWRQAGKFLTVIRDGSSKVSYYRREVLKLKALRRRVIPPKS